MPLGEPNYGHRKTLRPRRKPTPPNPPAHSVVEPRKPQVTISTSNILRRKPMKEVYGKKHSRKRESRHELFLDYQDRIETSRTTLLHTATTTLSETHASLTTSLSALQSTSSKFHDAVTEQRQALLAPLTDEKVETSFSRRSGDDDGKSVSVTEVLQIGPRVEEFKGVLRAKETELGVLWGQWRGVQGRIVGLGERVLGEGALEGREGGGGVGLSVSVGVGVVDDVGDGRGEERGYAKEMRDLDEEHQEWLEEMEEEIRLIGEETIRMMEATEKELIATMRKEQAKFFAQMFADAE